MPIEQVPQAGQEYYLVAFDKKGNKHTDDPDGLMHERVLDKLKSEPITDIVLISHGWLQDVQSAREHYAKWFEALSKCTADHQQLSETQPGFKPLYVALHWPSKPWGDETLLGSGDAPTSFAAPGAGEASGGLSTIDEVVEHFSDCLADSTEAIEALQKIATAAADNMEADKMPLEVAEAYQVLQKESQINSAGGFVAEGLEPEALDPDKSFQSVGDEVVSFSGSGINWGGLLWPLRQLSFWKMKDRARVFGQASGFPFLQMLQSASAARIHLLGHSFGCVALSAALAGPDEPNELSRPIDSLVLLQASMGLWAYAAARPGVGPAGYFHSIVADQRVAGPTVATFSENDFALVRVYPMAAGIAGQVSFEPGELPKYGAVGAYGLRGPGLTVADGPMLPIAESYDFRPHTIHNLDAGQYIRKGWGLMGAHNNVAKPEVAHVTLQALLASRSSRVLS